MQQYNVNKDGRAGSVGEEHEGNEDDMRVHLPTLVCCPVEGVVLCDVGVDATQSELFVGCGCDRLHNELGIREGWLRLVFHRGVRWWSWL